MLSNWSPRDAGSLIENIGRHSRVVMMFKFLLPAVALILIAVVLFISLTDSVNKGFRLDFTTLKEGEGDSPTMINPRFSGVDSRKQPYTILADEAVQQDSETVQLKNMRAEITLNNNSWFFASSKEGLLQISQKKLGLIEGVHLYSDVGYELSTPRAEVDLQDGVITGKQGISGQGPMGTLQSEEFTLYANAEKMRFSGDVRLVIHPRSRKN